jgi:hypothetical protein
MAYSRRRRRGEELSAVARNATNGSVRLQIIWRMTAYRDGFPGAGPADRPLNLRVAGATQNTGN